MSDRRRQQNFQSLPHYLHEGIWTAFTSQGREKCRSLLLTHVWKLGLRCPSEGTFAVILNLLFLGCADCKRPETSFERYELLQQLKRDWKQFKQAMKNEDMVYVEYVLELPSNPDNLPEEYKGAAFADGPPEPCRVLANDDERIEVHVR